MSKSARKGGDATAASDPDDRYRKIAGITALCVAGYLGLAFVAYLFTWRADQDSVLTYGWGILFEDVAVSNWLGPLGAIASHTAFFNGFGATSFLLVYLLAVTGLAILRRRPLVELQRQMRWGLVGLMGLSIMLAFLFQMFDFPIGGAYGYLVASSLESLIGIPGMLLLLALALVVLVVWIFNPTLDEIRSGTFLQRIELTPSLAGVGQVFAGRGPRGAGGDEAHDPAPPARKPVGKVRSYEGDEVDDEDAGAAGAVLPQGDDNESKVHNRGHRDEGTRTRATDTTASAKTPGASDAAASGPVSENLDGDTEADADADVVDLGHPVGVTTRKPTGGSAADDFELEITYASGDPIVEGEGADDEATDAELAVVPPTFMQRAGEKPRDVLAAEAEHEIEQQGPYDPKLDLRNYRYPEISLLKKYPEPEHPVTREELQENKGQIVDALMSFGLQIMNISATVGPTITLYEIIPAPGQRIAKFRNLSDDIALSLSALGIRIIAPMPGRGSIGVEVPNKNRQMVPLREVLSSERYRTAKMDLPIALGKTIQNETMVVDLAKMPHLLIAGATGQGKSVGINTIIMSLLYKQHPAEVKLVLVDPKKVELSLYSRLEKHFLTFMPGQEEIIITENKKAIHTLNALVIEMEERYTLLKAAGVRHISEYNQKFTERGLSPANGHKFLPYIVIIIDEFADLIMTAGKEIEQPIARIAQLARAVGLHLIIATQRPSVKIITGTIKANFPARLAFRVTSLIDSRTILDSGGAEQLIGQGDMLLSMGTDNVRVQCAFVDTPEVDRVLEFIEEQEGFYDPYLLPEFVGEEGEDGREAMKLTADSADEMLREAAHMVVDNLIGSTSMLQRRMKVGFNRAGRIMDELCMLGIVGEARGSKPREVIVRDVLELESMLDLFYSER